MAATAFGCRPNSSGWHAEDAIGYRFGCTLLLEFSQDLLFPLSTTSEATCNVPDQQNPRPGVKGSRTSGAAFPCPTLPPTCIGAVAYLFPTAFPLLSPDKRTLTDQADLRRKLAFLIQHQYPLAASSHRSNSSKYGAEHGDGVVPEATSQRPRGNLAGGDLP